MSSDAPKTGLARRMRAWMRAQQRPFTSRDVYLALGVADAAMRERLRNAMRDFRRRGEVADAPPDKRIRRQDAHRYVYVVRWRAARKGSLQPRIHKAMYVSGTWAVTDIQRLTDLDRDWIDKTVRRLRRDGYIAAVGRRPCAHGAGAEALYHIADRDRFRLEVMR